MLCRVVAGFLCCLAATFVACGGGGRTSVEPKVADVPGLAFVASKTEREGKGGDNLMETYVYSASLEAPELRSFLSQRKQQNRGYVFYFAVLFDDAANARFPGNPFNGGYLEEQDLRHIRAIYTATNFNNFSELLTYERNAWESGPKRVPI